MSDLLRQEEHRAVDGTRPLEVGSPPSNPSFAPTLHDPTAMDPLPCHVVVHNEAFSLEIPTECRRQIQPGDHYLLHTQRMNDTPTGLTWAYCAPCAVRDYHFWDVREATG
jgi:hypothetical protein